MAIPSAALPPGLVSSPDEAPPFPATPSRADQQARAARPRHDRSSVSTDRGSSNHSTATELRADPLIGAADPWSTFRSTAADSAGAAPTTAHQLGSSPPRPTGPRRQEIHPLLVKEAVDTFQISYILTSEVLSSCTAEVQAHLTNTTIMLPADMVTQFREGSPFEDICSATLAKHPLPPNVEEVWLILTPQWKDGKMTQFCQSFEVDGHCTHGRSPLSVSPPFPSYPAHGRSGRRSTRASS